VTAPVALTETERELLLRLARASIADTVLRDGSLDRARTGFVATAGLAAVHGVFVTIRCRDADGALSLRGCLGDTRSMLPLYLSVAQLAREAASSDPRFEPVRQDELSRLSVEVSVLGPFVRLVQPADLVLGLDGVQIRKGAALALFLPQVATEQGWTIEQLLGQLARKAGLTETGWHDAELSVFRSDHFAEPPAALG
jgi:AmmeMemoRadiSam system protein A